jgi:hypothetical protein
MLALADVYWFPGPRIVIIPLTCALVGFCLVAAIDAARKPESAYEQAGVRRWLWIVAPIAGSGCFLLVGFACAVLWFTNVRPRIVAELREGAA